MTNTRNSAETERTGSGMWEGWCLQLYRGICMEWWTLVPLIRGNLMKWYQRNSHELCHSFLCNCGHGNLKYVYMKRRRTYANVLSPLTCALPKNHLPSPPTSTQSLWSTLEGAQELNPDTSMLELTQVCGIGGQGMYMFSIIRYCPYLMSQPCSNVGGKISSDVLVHLTTNKESCNGQQTTSQAKVSLLVNNFKWRKGKLLSYLAGPDDWGSWRWAFNNHP